MGVDEVGTLNALKAIRRELADPAIAAHHGRIVKTTGDGILIEFPSVVDAVACAVAIQEGTVARNADVSEDRRIVFRIGINIGDIIIDEADIHGDGVNVAARLEALALPGGICLSGAAHDQVQGKIDAAFEDLGEQSLKNIARPVRVYRVVKGTAIASTPAQPSAERLFLPLPDKPSIAVLPFQNMSGDPEQEYFADGMVEEIITALSRFQNLFIIARNSTFTYKGKSVDVKHVGRELGVRYVLEGSVRKSGTRVRITGQLAEAAGGKHIWADRFDGELDDIFDLQDRVSASVISQIVPKLELVEIDRAKRRPTANLDAYDYFLRGISNDYQSTRASVEEALKLLYKAIDLDPGFASAHAWASLCYTRLRQSGWMADPERELLEGLRLARGAVSLGRDDAFALALGGFGVAYLGRDPEAGVIFIDRATALNPNLAMGWHASGWVRLYLGEWDQAIEHLTRAMRLSPLDPFMYQMEHATAAAHFSAERFEEASSWAASALRERPEFVRSICIFAASSALIGRLPEARAAILRARKLNPELSISSLLSTTVRSQATDFAKWSARFEEGLVLAGLPK
jgi:adenylate cyclase